MLHHYRSFMAGYLTVCGNQRLFKQNYFKSLNIIKMLYEYIKMFNILYNMSIMYTPNDNLKKRAKSIILINYKIYIMLN